MYYNVIIILFHCGKERVGGSLKLYYNNYVLLWEEDGVHLKRNAEKNQIWYIT